MYFSTEPPKWNISVKTLRPIKTLIYLVQMNQLDEDFET